MAASHRSRRIDGSAHNGSAGSSTSQLPGGSCNYRDLKSGARAPVCGCRQFWLDEAHMGGRRAYCFCGHHACFHTVFSQQTGASVHGLGVEDEGNGKWQHLGRDTPEGYSAVHHAGAGASESLATGLGIHQQSQSQSINTRVWEALNGFARQQDESASSDSASKLPSTAVPSTNGDEMPYKRPMGPPIVVPNAPAMRAGFEEYFGSATEVATPSIAGTPDMRAFMPPGSQTRFLPASQHVSSVSLPIEAAQMIKVSETLQLSVPGPSVSGATPTPDVRHLMEAYGRRLDILESMSFSHISAEDIHEKFEHQDLRLLELETWRADLDRNDSRHSVSPEALAASGSKRRRVSPDEISLDGSDGSFDSTAAANTEAAVLATIVTNMENAPRFDDLESRITDLENNALPSVTRPWQVQVALLPWGRHLRGMWFASDDATQQSQRSAAMTDEWTGVKSTVNTSFNSSASAAWTTESIEAWAQDAQDWLSPKACGPNGSVFQRLASRGFVRELTLTAGDARHVMDQLMGAFQNVLPSFFPTESELHQTYHGLQESLIPLRKVRKSARLRFLTPAEMITPATWTADFLDSSVFMKVDGGRRRLYITTPDAYVQDNNDGHSWRTLQRMPSIHINSFSQQAQAEAGRAIESCWSYSDKLDHAPSLQSSFGSQASHESQWSLKSQASAHEGAPQQYKELESLINIRPLRQRTVSLPSSTSMPDQQQGNLPQRRVASFDLASSSSHQIYSSDAASPVIKRRRITISPEAERRGVNFTPRWSREPPSPFRSDSNFGASRSGSGVARGTTPFAYATPHSNSHVVGLADLVGCGDGDTELGTDVAGNVSQQGDADADEEWNGVNDLGIEEHNVHMDGGNDWVQDGELNDEDVDA